MQNFVKNNLSMGFSVERNALLKTLAHQQSLIERRNSIPILSHVLIETKDGNRISFTGTDLEISLTEILKANVTAQGAVALPAHILYDIVRKLPENVLVTIESQDDSSLGGQVKISCDSIEFTLPSLPVTDFPRMLLQELPFNVKVPAHLFKRLIEDTKFSMSTEEARYSLNGIYFHSSDDHWCAVATDAHRLALSWIPLETPDGWPNVIIGRKTIQEVSKLLDECPQDISIFLSANQFVLEFKENRFSSRLLEGQFPDYRQAIPATHPHKIELDVHKLAQAISRVGMVSAQDRQVIKLEFKINELFLSASSQQYGSAVEQMSIIYEGESFSLGFNPKYFLDVCNHIKGDKIRLVLKDNSSPALCQDLQDDRVSYVLMPMQVY